MTRWNSPANATAAAQTSIAMVTLCDLDFSDQTINVHDGYSQLVVNGTTYYGLGDYGSVDLVEESTETIAKSITLLLNLEAVGPVNTLLNEIMVQDFQGRQVVLYVGLLDVNAMSWIATPEVVWEGRMDYATIGISQGKTSVEMKCESRLNREPLVARYTDVDQQLAYPGDTFFDLLYLIPLSTVGWGGVTVQYPSNPGTGRGNLGGIPTGHPGPTKPGINQN